MPFIAAVTQPDWIEVLRQSGYEGQVNFWRPSASGFSSRHLGQNFVFVVKGKWPREVAGYGTVVQYLRLPVSAAWDCWGKGNGVDSLQEFRSRLEKVLRATHSNEGSQKRLSRGLSVPEQVTDDFQIGCIVLRDLVLFPKGTHREDGALSGFPKNLVHYAVMKTPFPFELAPSSTTQVPTDTAEARELPSVYSHTGLSQEQIEAIEYRAVAVCREAFSGWDLYDVSTPDLARAVIGVLYPGYDFLARLGAVELHIEVKGTTMGVPAIKITTNELRNAIDDKTARLFVVKDVALRLVEGQWAASGGSPKLCRWRGRHHLAEIFDHLGTQSKLHLITLVGGQWEIDVGNTDLLEPDSGILA